LRFVTNLPVTPGDYELCRAAACARLTRAGMPWSMVQRANMSDDSELGGHISSASLRAAMLYDIGYNHFWHAPSE
jgi:pyruvate dehydrogenase complex dehydrogenase (E1) component